MGVKDPRIFEQNKQLKIMAQNNDSKRLWLGIIFFIIGGLLLVDNLDLFYFNIPYYVFSWPTFLILLGLYLFFGQDKKAPGAILLALGSVFLLDDIFPWWHIDFWDVFLPGVLIFLGVALMMRKSTPSARPSGGDEQDFVDDMAVFSGNEKKMTSQNFKGGKITSVFGGSKIDFTQSAMNDEGAVIDVFTLFGGTEVIVPVDWSVKSEVTSIFGGISDKRNSVVNVVPDESKVLTIKGLILFGGGEIKSN